MRPLSARFAGLVALALLAFAGNSILTRAALADGGIAAETFAGIRLLSGALMLVVITALRRIPMRPQRRDLPGIAALFIYAAAFSAAYVAMGAATGALVLFASVQFTMIGSTLLQGARIGPVRATGLALAMAGLAWLLWPGLAPPPLWAFGLMVTAGIAWGIYSILGRGDHDPVARTARNFIGTVPFAVLLVAFAGWRADAGDIALAVASGAVTSALGYVTWYAVLPGLGTIAAGSLQLTVPVIAAVGSLLWLGEPLSAPLIGASLLILSGIALTLRR